MSKNINVLLLKQERQESMIDYMGMLREFHLKYNHYIHDKIPQDQLDIPHEVRSLRFKLIDEEVTSELLPQVDPTHFEIYSIELLADALADSLYVIFGTALSYGIPMDEVFAEVHRSNMTKSMEKDTKSIKGKTIKGLNFESPRIAEVLHEHSRLAKKI